jgi:hypothetical protein
MTQTKCSVFADELSALLSCRGGLLEVLTVLVISPLILRRLDDKPLGRRRRAIDRHGERKTVISGDSNDFRALAATGGTHGEAPFLALAKVAPSDPASPSAEVGLTNNLSLFLRV